MLRKFLELLGLKSIDGAFEDPCGVVQHDFNDAGKQHSSSEHFLKLHLPFQPELNLASLCVLTHSINRIPQLKADVGGRAQTYFWTYNAMQYTEIPLLQETVGWRQAECVGDGGMREHMHCYPRNFFPHN